MQQGPSSCLGGGPIYGCEILTPATIPSYSRGSASGARPSTPRYDKIVSSSKCARTDLAQLRPPKAVDENLESVRNASAKDSTTVVTCQRLKPTDLRLSSAI